MFDPFAQVWDRDNNVEADIRGRLGGLRVA